MIIQVGGTLRISTLGYKLDKFTQAHRLPGDGETFYLWVGFREDWNSTEGVCCLSFFGVLTVGPSWSAAGSQGARIISITKPTALTPTVQ